MVGAEESVWLDFGAGSVGGGVGGNRSSRRQEGTGGSQDSGGLAAGHVQQHGRADRPGSDATVEGRRRIHHGIQLGGRTPTLEVALFEYGNDGLPAEEGHIRLIVPFTGDLDKVSKAFFALTTNGGQEYCGRMIDCAARRLAWSESNTDLEGVFIAGNEPFTQGGVDYRQPARPPRPRASRSTRSSAEASTKACRRSGRTGPVGRRGVPEHRPEPADRCRSDAARQGTGPIGHNQLDRTYCPTAMPRSGWKRPSGKPPRTPMRLKPRRAWRRLGLGRQSLGPVPQFGLGFGGCTQRRQSEAQQHQTADELPEALRTLAPAERKAHVEGLRRSVSRFRTRSTN